MKKIGVLIFLLISIMSVSAQKGHSWQQLSDMKSVMKQTFPPLIKDNNLQPIKDNAAKLYDAAVLLQNGTKPRALRKKAMNEKFSSITSLSKSLKELVENKASDEDIKNEMVSLHAAFAEIAHH